ncbi:MAG: hypothetical protein JWN00_5335 [Actinomycetia bacterium]|nr:hypothetical protein [Actinomycetes bacterium]
MTDWITTPIDARILRCALEVERTARGVFARLHLRRPRLPRYHPRGTPQHTTAGHLRYPGGHPQGPPPPTPTARNCNWEPSATHRMSPADG